MSRIFKIQTLVALGLLLTYLPIATGFSDDKGRGGHKGHSHANHGNSYHGNGHHDHDHSSSFFGLGPGGFSYGYQNDNFGILLGPIGGGGGYAPYYDSAPVYNGGYVDPGIYGNGYGNGVYSQPVITSPAAPVTNAVIDAPSPGVGETSYQNGASTESFYRQSVEAFQRGDYAASTRLADHAIVDDPSSGPLRIHASQCLLAAGEFEASAAALSDGLQKVDPTQWGSEVKDFRNLYKLNDYVSHIKKLEQFAAENPQAAFANALCAYHFYYLGHPGAAKKHLDVARKANPDDSLVKLLSPVIEPEGTKNLPAPTSILVPAK